MEDEFEDVAFRKFLAGLDDAVDISIKKGIQLVDEQGERMFG